jgi:hypothetical protein
MKNAKQIRDELKTLRSNIKVYFKELPKCKSDREDFYIKKAISEIEAKINILEWVLQKD